MHIRRVNTRIGKQVVDMRDLWNGRSLAYLGEYGRDEGLFYKWILTTIHKHVKGDAPSLTFADVGANIGWFSNYLAHELPFVNCEGFEPQERICRMANLNARLAGVEDRVVFHNLGVSDAPRTLYINEEKVFARSDCMNTGGVMLSDSGTTGVECIRLDDWRWRVGPPVLLKIDVESHEKRVLQGASRLLEEYCPIVVFEADSGAAAVDTIKYVGEELRWNMWWLYTLLYTPENWNRYSPPWDENPWKLTASFNVVAVSPRTGILLDWLPEVKPGDPIGTAPIEKMVMFKDSR